MKIALFDRDGTLIKEPSGERLIKKSDIELYDDSVEALKILAESGYAIIIITNQAGVSEGLITLEEFYDIHNAVLDQLAPSGIKILKTYVCPHSPEDNCICRKPKPKMILDAAKDFNLDLQNMFFVGDRQTDCEAAQNAGCKSIFLNTSLQAVEPSVADYEVNNLLQAAEVILDN